MRKLISIFFFIVAFHFQVAAQGQGHGGLTHYVDGVNFQKTGQHRKAIDEFNKALRSEPSNFKYLHAKALSEFQLKDNESSINSLVSLLKLKDDFAPAYVLLAKIYYQQGDYNKAADYYDLAAKHETNQDDKYKYKMLVTNKYIKDGNMKVAYEKAKELKSIAPKDLKASYYFARIANKVKKYEDARNAIVDIEPQIKSQQAKDNAKYYYELGYAYYFMEDYEKARLAFDRTQTTKYWLMTEKLSAKYFCKLALAYQKFHDNETSKKYLDMAEKIQKDLPEVHVLRAQLSRRLTGKTGNQSTISHYENAVKTEPNPAKRESIYEKIAEMYLEGENYEGALRTSDEALKLNPNDAKAMLNKINALYKLGKAKEAVELSQNTLKQKMDAPTAADITFLLGLSAKKIGDKAVAKQAFFQLGKTSLRDAAEVELKSMGELRQESEAIIEE
jgi:tetratricopeptide (TPR) repeat protein